MKTIPIRRRRKKPLVGCRGFPKFEVGENDVSLSFSDCPPLRLRSIQIVVPSKNPVTAAEIETARAKFRKLLKKELPLKDCRCVIPIGENIAEVVTEHPKPLSKVQFEEVFRHISKMMTVFPEKIEKTTKIFEELIE